MEEQLTIEPQAKTEPQKKLTAKDLLLCYIRDVKHAKTSDILRWGLQAQSNRADRNARQLATEGKIKRMAPEIKKHLYGDKIKEEVWEFVE